MAAQVLEQSSGSGMFSHSNIGISSNEELCGLNYLSKNDLTAAPQLVMLANVALTGDISCYDSHGEDRLMAELKTVDDNLSDNEEDLRSDVNDTLQSENVNTENQSVPNVVTKRGSESSSQVLSTDSPEVVNPESLTDKGKKSKPFRCRPCDYEAESEMEFVHHIKVHSAKKFIVEENAEKQSKSKVPDPLPEEADISKGPIRCDRCGYNTNRYDHYLAHLKHHEKVGENEKVYKCTICTYTTVSEYHWKKHLRNHFPRKVYTCSQCSYFSDRKNNYVQHMRTHTGERPYKCPQCPYSSSQKTHLTRHMRTHSGEKPFKCDQCNYVASNQHEVTRHARQVHNGPKPLTCPHCEYRTADRSNFKKHVELHVNPRQFLCPVCKYAASKKCNLQYHIKSKHPHCSDITMDVSKVKLRTKRLELDVPLAKIGKKMSDKLKRAGDLDKRGTVKAEKTSAVSKEHNLGTINSKVKAQNCKAFSHKHLSRKRDKDTKKVKKIKDTKRKRGLTVPETSPQESSGENPVAAKRKKMGKVKELIEPEAQRSRIKLDKASHRKSLKCKRVKKKNKRYRKYGELSTGDGPNKCNKSDQPVQQPFMAKKKKDGSRNSSNSNSSVEDLRKREPQNSESYCDQAVNKAPLGTVIEQNENSLNVHSAENASKIVQKITKESQTSFDQLTVPESGKTILTETLTVEEMPTASTEHARALICSSGHVEDATHSFKTSDDLSNLGTKEMSAETDLISGTEQEGSVQVISIELAFELSNSNNSNADQDGIACHEDVQDGKDDQMKVKDGMNKQMDIQDGQSRLQKNVSEVPDALDDQKSQLDCTHKIQNGQPNQDQPKDNCDKVEKSKQEQNKNPNKDEVMEIDEDEGIHSHEGSEISEDSEGSDDSGLNGAKTAPDSKINKRTPEDNKLNFDFKYKHLSKKMTDSCVGHKTFVALV
ncbi:RE1-silencing transcription factor isoform X2 [Narcine bancroftii]|uniref:RE1-silencing transcription factor isoform X2 n=1 Tax=Narcine bancroftii TaxID=1343680 RepID=UPI00383148EF